MPPLAPKSRGGDGHMMKLVVTNIPFVFVLPNLHVKSVELMKPDPYTVTRVPPVRAGPATGKMRDKAGSL